MTILHPAAFVVCFDTYALGSQLISGDSYQPWLWWLVALLSLVAVVLVGLRLRNEDARPDAVRTGVTTNSGDRRHGSA